MLYIEILGFVAAGFVLTTFLMRTMLLLRIAGICGNIAFMSYGWFADLTPVIILHAILLPINVYRLFEMIRLIQATRNEAAAVSDLSWLIPYSTLARFKAGSTIFRRGESADAMYIITSGRIRLDEPEVELGKDSVFGEIGIFTVEGKRTATATCLEDCSAHMIKRATVEQMVLQNPQFAFYLIGIVTQRLADNLDQVESRLADLRLKVRTP